MARHNAAQASSLSSLPQLDMYETTVSGRDSTEAAYLQLRRAILRNELPSGKHLSQRELEQRFGVGRTPLREALRMLQREGLVEAEPNHRVRVASFSFSDLEQLYATRINLEALAIRLTVPCLQTADLDRLEGFFTRMEELGTLEAYEQWEVPHRAFHLGLVAYAGPRIVTLVAQLSDHAERYRRFYSMETPHAFERGMREHRSILDACLARDPAAAAEQLARHYSSVVLGTLAVLAPEYDPMLVRTALHGVMQNQSNGLSL
ncbi:MAG TPA: GntR family transcriptional regulator [Ktedonobacteraceae bacterium]|nr:GntR family transcriptional regulator [Ktedonobacteraceae bacterium]